ncbi:MAG: PEP-CTERM sorting domain-containing protein [Kiritimatiellales bacterium]|nr:PEP-CTERM sorting domain-containing protein [Kiritimatiellales bacterium]
MKRNMNKTGWWMVFVVGCMAVSSGRAAVVTFTGTSGVDSNFSTAANWSSGTVPVAADTTYVAASQTLIVDGVYTVGNFRANALSGAAGMSYVEIVSGAALSDGSITVGNVSASYNGTLTLHSGGATHTTANNGGVLSIGGTGAGMIGNMVVEAGAVFEQSRLTLNTYGTLDFVFGVDSVSTFTSKKTTVGNANILDGMLEVDLGALATAGTYTLINSASANLQIGGTLRTWLDGNGGSYSNSGSYVGSNFTVLNGDGKDWTLSLADNNQDLTLTVIPEPATLGLIGLAGFGALAIRRLIAL